MLCASFDYQLQLLVLFGLMLFYLLLLRSARPLPSRLRSLYMHISAVAAIPSLVAICSTSRISLSLVTSVGVEGSAKHR